MADRGRHSQRMAKRWSQMGSGQTTMTAAGTFIAGVALSFDGPFTVLRMIGEYVISPTSAPAALDNAIVAVGIGVVSTDAFAVGGGAMPDPADEPE